MKIDRETIIGTIVANDYRASSVFKQYEIDFCCNGDRSIEEVAKGVNISPEQLIEQLQVSLKTSSSGGIDFRSWPLDLLTDYIVKKHHRYIRERKDEISAYLKRIVEVHGVAHPELIEVEKLFNASVSELIKHMKEEEESLFIYVADPATAPAGTKELLEKFMEEHDVEGERFREIAKITNGYTVPSDGCNTYRAAYAMLKEFEEDLHHHIHLENNILFKELLKKVEM